MTQDTLISLFDKLSRKTHTDYHGERVGPGWLKYEWNDTIWNLDDGTAFQRSTSPDLVLTSLLICRF